MVVVVVVVGRGGCVQDQDMGFYSTLLNSVSTQCARDKPSVARKPEENPKILSDKKPFQKCNHPAI